MAHKKRNKRLEKVAYKRKRAAKIRANEHAMMMEHGCFLKGEVIKYDPLSNYGGAYLKDIQKAMKRKVRYMKNEDMPLGKSNAYRKMGLSWLYYI